VLPSDPVRTDGFPPGRRALGIPVSLPVSPACLAFSPPLLLCAFIYDFLAILEPSLQLGET